MADKQLDLFAAPKPERPSSELAADRPFATTARDAEHLLGQTAVSYVGFVCADGTACCRSCLDHMGATHALGGGKFYHYLWSGTSKLERFECEHCGISFEAKQPG